MFRLVGLLWFLGVFRDDRLDRFRRIVRLVRFVVIFNIIILWSRFCWLFRFERGIRFDWFDRVLRNDWVWLDWILWNDWNWF